MSPVSWLLFKLVALFSKRTLALERVIFETLLTSSQPATRPPAHAFEYDFGAIQSGMIINWAMKTCWWTLYLPHAFERFEGIVHQCNRLIYRICSGLQYCRAALCKFFLYFRPFKYIILLINLPEIYFQN